MSGTVLPLRVDEATLLRATTRFLRSHAGDRVEIEKLYHKARAMGLKNADGQLSILAADDAQRRELFGFLVENTRAPGTYREIVITASELEAIRSGRT